MRVSLQMTVKWGSNLETFHCVGCIILYSSKYKTCYINIHGIIPVAMAKPLTTHNALSNYPSPVEAVNTYAHHTQRVNKAQKSTRIMNTESLSSLYLKCSKSIQRHNKNTRKTISNKQESCIFSLNI